MSSANILALVLTALSLFYFLYIGLRSVTKTKSLIGFFLANKDLDRKSLSHTMAAAGLSNATVAIAYLLIFPAFGIWTIIAFFANLCGQLLFIRLIKHVVNVTSYDLGGFTTIGDLLMDATASKRLSNLSDLITLVGFMAALLAEFIIGSQLFSSVMPNLKYSDYIGFIVVAAIVICYIISGGFVATVESDSWQLLLITAACFSLLIISLAVYFAPLDDLGNKFVFNWFGAAPTNTTILWAVNTVLLSVFFPIGQLTSWQRVAATKAEERLSGLWSGLLILIFLWLVFASAGFAFAYRGIPVATWGDVFSVMFQYGGIFIQFLYPILFLGLVAAMISTADTNAVAIILTRFSGKFHSVDLNWSYLKKRIWKQCSLLFILIVFFFIFYKEFGQSNTLLNIIFSLFGLYLLLVPIVAKVIIGGSIIKSDTLPYFGLLLGTVILIIFSIYGLQANNLAFVLCGNLIGVVFSWGGVMIGFERKNSNE